MLEDVLDKMDPDKRLALINSALKEFGNNSYAKASTNTIVKEAGISKGLLYHYFKNKKSLYNYLIEFLYKKTAMDLLGAINLEETDIFERISRTLDYKIELIKRYPAIVDFTKSFYKDKSFEELKALIDSYVPGYYERFYHTNIDYSLFKEDIDISKALNVFQWTVEKFSETYTMLYITDTDFDLKKLRDEFKPYLDMMKKAFYKDPSNNLNAI